MPATSHPDLYEKLRAALYERAITVNERKKDPKNIGYKATKNRRVT